VLGIEIKKGEWVVCQENVGQTEWLNEKTQRNQRERSHRWWRWSWLVILVSFGSVFILPLLFLYFFDQHCNLSSYYLERNSFYKYSHEWVLTLLLSLISYMCSWYICYRSVQDSPCFKLFLTTIFMRRRKMISKHNEIVWNQINV